MTWSVGDEARGHGHGRDGAQRGALGARSAPLQSADDQAFGEERGARDLGAGCFFGCVCGGCAQLTALWWQPKGGTVKDQYPVLRIHGDCYTMSLRMMKAVWYDLADDGWTLVL